ncbi:unnamed protein product [Gordionus sp. m RMFG-2023]|uniref:kinase D-interacting substrate of 220 kDa-like n=1 Tax=Gordionus sp. m RMFG-2023 TaxID=3053472 RepID=UPI0030E267D7
MKSNDCVNINEILKVIEDKDIIKFGELLANFNSHINVIVDPNGQSLLHYAALSSYEIVEELLNRNSYPDAVDHDQWTPLMLASKAGHADICNILLKHGADVDHRDLGGWTSLMWACYKGRFEVVNVLLKYQADMKIREEHGMSPIMWASGRGYSDIVESLLKSGAKAQSVDKFNSSALLWACRKGYKDCAKLLIDAGADLDTVGMNGWTPILAATKGNYVNLVKLLLEHNLNLNHRDKDGMTAMALASNYGFVEIVDMLLARGAHGALSNFHNDTCLILACKNGHYPVANTLLAHNLGTDAQGYNGKTALYWAAEKNYNDIIMLLLRNKCDMEIVNENGETALLRAIHNRNSVAVQMLIDAGADVGKPDKKGDTALHIAVRMRSKHLTEMLLRNPKNSKLLYVPNNAGQTAYNIDAQSANAFLPYLFGAQHLKTFDYTENMLGYDLYSSALSDVLCDPMLGLPLTVGLYAKWGSGKSFLLKKLQEEMITFTDNILQPTFHLTNFISLISVFICMVPSLFLGVIISWVYGFILFIALLILIFTFYGFILISKYFGWERITKLNLMLAIKFEKLKLFFQIIYCNPSTENLEESIPQGIRFLFTDYAKLTTMGGEKSLAGMVATLCHVAEKEFGLLTVRFFRVFHPKINDKLRTKTCFFIPKYIVAMIVALSLVSLIALAFRCLWLGQRIADIDSNAFRAILGLSCIVVIAFIANIPVWKRLFQFSFYSQAKRVMKSADLDPNKLEGFMQKVKMEVNHLVDLVQTIDLFTNRHTRLVVVIDGLDSCEQDKILQVLEAVKTLFSDTKAPFITILAIDPHIIIRAIESNLNSAFQKSSIKGYDYLRNAVSLPIFLQRQGLLQFCIGKGVNSDTRYKNFYKKSGLSPVYSSSTLAGPHTASLKSKPINQISSKFQLPFNQLKGPRSSFTGSVISCSQGYKGSSLLVLSSTAPEDLKKIFTNDHYFSDVNPRSLRRLTNIVYVSGRLMKAFSIDFQWVRLATWVNMIEQWPYRSSWIILYFEENEHYLDNQITLKQIYDCVSPFIPSSREIEPFLEYDKNDVKLVYMLSGSNVKLLVADMKLFLPFSVNLDPYIKKVIREHIGDILKHKPIASGSIKELDPSEIQKAIINSSHISDHTRIPKSNKFYPELLPSDNEMDSLERENLIQVENVSHIQNLNTEQRVIISSLFENLKISKKPAQLTSTDISDLMAQIPDLNDAQDLKNYQNIVKKNNINGFVLLTCDKHELQKILPMNFGDWHIFMGFILYLRYLANSTLPQPANLPNKSSLIENNRFLYDAANIERLRGDHMIQSSESHIPGRLHNDLSKTSMSHIEREVEQEQELLSAAISKFEENDINMLDSDAEEDYENQNDEINTSAVSKEISPIQSSAPTHYFRNSINLPYFKNFKNPKKFSLSIPSTNTLNESIDDSRTENTKRELNKKRLEPRDFNFPSNNHSENFPLLKYEQRPDTSSETTTIHSPDLETTQKESENEKRSSDRLSMRKASMKEEELNLIGKGERLKKKIKTHEEDPAFASLDYCPQTVMHLTRKESKVKDNLERLQYRKNSLALNSENIPAIQPILNSDNPESNINSASSSSTTSTSSNSLQATDKPVTDDGTMQDNLAKTEQITSNVENSEVVGKKATLGLIDFKSDKESVHPSQTEIKKKYSKSDPRIDIINDGSNNVVIIQPKDSNISAGPLKSARSVKSLKKSFLDWI